jgi:MoxR-like ATPase
VQDLLEFTRSCGRFQVGLSPRAGLNLLMAAKSWAFIAGRDYTLPEDVQEVMPWVLGHRLRSREDLAEMPAEPLMALLREVPIP